MKVAIIHDQLQEFGGAERVLVSLKKIFPETDIYTSFYNPQTLGIHRDNFEGWNIKTSWAEKVPFLKRLYSPLRFITPLIWESLDLKDYDLVISSSGSYMCKGIITRPETLHICYLHHPPRYLYYYETAVEWQKYWPIKIYGNLINHNLRLWDYLSSQRVDYFIANSQETKKRVEKFYRRDAQVIYPPVEIPQELDLRSSILDVRDYYLTVSRLARAKHVDILIEAANKHGFKLKIVGSGRDEKYLRSIAGPNVELLGAVDDKEKADLYKNSKAFLFSAVDEEFGIAPIEAMGYGLPVIAYSDGGLKETVNEGKNGYLFNEFNKDSLIKKIKELENLSSEEYQKMSHAARQSAEQYSEEKFKEKILNFVNHARTSRS
ncbi:MAG: glycosyltransferase [Candidatus Roizmanbacteria bacterium]|nr:MAG: glycosyltransferase [Candidatus Roizmanbacteria bacterium]